MAEFLAANFADTPFNIAETPIEADTRIQNLAFREDTILGQVEPTITGLMDELEDNFPEIELDDSVLVGLNLRIMDFYNRMDEQFLEFLASDAKCK